MPHGKEEIIAAVETMSVLDLADLVKALQERFGVSAAPQTVTTISDPVPPEAEIQTSFDVVLTSAGDKKIQVIKAVREVTTLGLKEAKDLVDSAPKAVKEGITREEAEQIKASLEEQGAQVVVR